MQRLLRRFSSTAPASHPAFVLLRSEAIKEQSAHANLYRHTGTGAEVLSVVCPTDVEKVFGAAFLTVPGDDTGVAHILEHSVLCGSAKYPSKEPFVTLMATSLQTYLNAMTYPDRTVYPVASPNLADFYNLTRVYLDAVLSPRLGKWALAQEGWHLEVERGGKEGGGKPTLKASGVVYNEMKGVYSNADSLHAMACDAALFPDTHYSRSSGGDPLAITSLTLERYTAFHAENYHPSRARLWFSGDDPELKRLEILHEFLEPFSSSSSSSSSSTTTTKKGAAVARVHPDTMGTQAPFPEPRWVTLPYPAAAAGEGGEGGEGEEGEEDGEEGGEDTGRMESAAVGSSKEEEEKDTEPSSGSSTPRPPVVRPSDHTSWSCASATREGYDTSPPSTHLPGHYATVNWCVGGGGVSVGEQLDPTTRLSLAILSHLLMGTQTATLRKALTDSGLGSSVTGGGYDDSGVQATFAAGLKGVAGKDVARVEAVVLHALTMAAGAGFDASHVEASMNTVEFGLREFATGGGPKGLSLFLGAAGPWVHGGDPIEEMRYIGALEGVKERVRVEGGGAYFSGLVTTYLLSNPHRVTVHSWPDEAWGARRDEAERVWLEGVGRTLDEEQGGGGWKRVEEEALELKRRQSEPDREEDVALIPRLTLGDLDPKAPTLPFANVVAGAGAGQSSPTHTRAAFVSSLQDTAGIGYLRFYVSAAHVPPHLLPLLPLLAWGLTSTGSAMRDETELSRAIGASTGGVGAGCGVWDTTLPDGSLLGVPYLSLAGKALGGKGGALGGLLQECLLHSSLAKRERVVTYLKEKIARAESGMVSSGHSLASALLSVTQGGGAGEVSRMRDVLSGLTSLRVARVLLDRIEKGEEGGWEGVVEDLHALRSALLAAPPPPASPTSPTAAIPHVIAATIGDASLMGEFQGCAEGVVKGIEGYGSGVLGSLSQGLLNPRRRTPLPQFPFPLTAEEHALGVSIPGSNMGIDPSDLATLFPSSSSSSSSTLSTLDFSVQVPASVNFVVKGGRIPGLSIIPPPPPSHTYPLPSPLSSVYRLPPTLEPTLAFLRTGFLWERVRVAGGAYGAGVSLNYSSGTMSYHSYRDPNVGGTLGVFDGVGEALRGAVAGAVAKGGGGKSLLEGPILSTIGSMDAPLSPVERGDKALNRWMHGVSPEQSQWWRDGVRGAGEGDVLALAQAADSIAQGGRVAVVGNGEAGEKKAWVESRRGGGDHAPLSP